MAFKMNGSPAKMGTISGTAGHGSALKMKAEADAASALKQMTISKEELKDTKWHSGADIKGDVTVSATGKEITAGGKTVSTSDRNTAHKAILEKRWKKGDKASGGTLNELVAARKKHKKGSAEYAEIQNKINKSLGSKKVHTATKTTKSGETKVVKPKGTKEVDGKTVMKGLGANKGKTLSYTDKQAEKVKIEKANKQIKEGKATKDKNKRDEGQLEKGEIRSGRDNAKTGTVVSRWFGRQKVKRNKRQLAKRNKKEE